MNMPDKNSDKNSDKHDELRQQLWELAYGLLEPEAEAAVRAQIKSDPAIARLYAEVRLQADLVGAAARVHDSSMHIAAGPDAKVTKVDAKKSSKHPSRKSLPAAEAQGWNTNWLAIGGTVALIALLAFGLYLPQQTKDSVAAVDYYFTTIIAPANTPAGVSQTVQLKTVSVDERGRPAEVALRVVDPQGNETFRKRVRTGEDGSAEVDLPGSVVQPGNRVEAIPEGEEASPEHKKGEIVSAELKVVPEPKRTLVLLETPRAKPGDKVGYSETQLGIYSKQAKIPVTDDLVMESGDGKAVVEPKWKKDEAAGSINGQFEVPSDPSPTMMSYNFRRRSEVPPNELAENAPQNNSLKEQGLERQNFGTARAGLQPNAGAQNGALQGGAGLRGSAMDAQRTLAPSEGAPPPGLGGERGGGKQGSPPSAARGGASANAAPAKAPAIPAPAIETPSPTAPPPAPAPTAPAPRAMAAPGAPKAEAGAPAPPTGAGTPNRKNAESQLTEKKAEGNLGATTADSADRPVADKSGAKKAVPETRGFEKPGTVTKSLADPMTRGMKPKAVAANDERPLVRDELPEAKPAADAKSSADLRRNRFAEGQLSVQKAQSVAAAQDSQELRQLQIPQELLGQPAILVARQHGLQVYHREIASLQESDHFVELPKEVEGRVEVELYRPGSTQPAYRQQIVRTAARALRFDVQGLQESYAPGEKVTLQVAVRDELENPVAATVGVRVWNDVAARQVKSPLLLVDALQLEPQSAPQELAKASDRALVERFAPVIQKPVPFGVAAPAAAAGQNGAAPGLQAAGTPQNPALPPAELAVAPEAEPAGGARQKRVVEQEETRRESAATAPHNSAELLAEQQVELATQSESFFFVNQNVVADNRAVIEQEYQSAKAATEAARVERMQTVGRLLLWAGAGLMLLIAGLLIARRPLKAAVWVPAVGIAALSLALGLAWFVPEHQAGRELARLEEPAPATTASTFGAAPANESQAAPAISPAPVVDDLESVRLREFASNSQPADAPQALPATLPIAPTDPTAAAPGGFAGGALPPQPAKPGLAMRAKSEPQDQPVADNDTAKKDDARKQASERLAVEKEMEAKKAASNAPARNAPAGPGEATDKTKIDRNAAANVLQAKAAEAGRYMLERAAGGAGRGESAAPDSIYFQPFSRIGSDGRFKIEFTMPAVESDYLLLLDAFGDGRMGGQVQKLVCREKK